MRGGGVNGAEWPGENGVQENLLPVAQEPLELENRRTGAPLHPGLLEHSVVRA